jgi:hypothetical protein
MAPKSRVFKRTRTRSQEPVKKGTGSPTLRRTGQTMIVRAKFFSTWAPINPKEIYSREIIAALNYEIHQMSFIPPSLLFNSNN